MLVTNTHHYGHLINADNYDVTLPKPEFYQLIDNKLVIMCARIMVSLLSVLFLPQDWEYRYIHEDYEKMKSLDTVIEQVGDRIEQ